MANRRYLKGQQAFLEGSVAWLTDNIKAVLVSAGYTPNTATDQFLSDIGANIVATSANFSGKTSNGGTADATDLTFPAVSGALVQYLVIYKNTGVFATSPLIMLVDTAVNLPLTPNGGDIVVQWDNGTDKIFTLFAGLKEADRSIGVRLRDWLRSPGGIWIPEPTFVLKGA